MLINIRTSEANKPVVQELTKKMNLGTENYVSRIAFAYSLSKGITLSLEKDLLDSKGKEYKNDILFGKYREYYMALICQHYNLYKTDKDIGKYIKMHIDHGLTLMNRLFEDNRNYSGLDFLLENIEKGIEKLEESDVSNDAIILDDRIRSLRVTNKDYYAERIQIRVGTTLDTDEPIIFNLNNTDIHNNAHVAIAGNSGTGKTGFANSFLSQVVTETKGAVNFIYLDFKGLKKEDEKRLQPFFSKTNATYIDAPQKPFPINPLAFIDNVNAKNQIMGINKFVDIITSYSNIGKNQQQTLKDATRTAFDARKNGEYPSIADIFRIVNNIDSRPSTLKEILQSLSELDLFETKVDAKNQLLNNNYYLSLSGDLPRNVRFTSVFLIINYLYNTFMNMDNAPIEGKYQGMRYILLIDEAHTIFKEKKSQDLLEKILREIRSKGVSVVLLSQGIEEFNQPSFDFSSMCETAFLFDIKDKTNLKLMQKFLGIGERDAQKLKSSMEQIQKYQLISNLKEYEAVKLFKA
jgi:DNA sulfur modification protein DndE